MNKECLTLSSNASSLRDLKPRSFIPWQKVSIHIGQHNLTNPAQDQECEKIGSLPQCRKAAQDKITLRDKDSK